MTHQQKVARLIVEMSARGVPKTTVAPRAFQLLWKLGYEIPPPLFLGFVPIAVLMGSMFGLYFGTFFGTFMWFLIVQYVMPLPIAVVTFAIGALFAGAGFGLWMADHFVQKGRQLALPPWHEYEPTA